MGNLVASDPSGEYGPVAIYKDHPEWFSDEVIPESFAGEPFRDPEFRWVGTVLSAFGICYNEDTIARLGIEEPPFSWNDLTDPRLLGQVALADPTKSGSTTKAFEMLIQEQMQASLRKEGVPAEHAIARGWDEAMRMILKISANARYFTDSSAKVPRDVAQGDAAAGMCIDFYGRTFNEMFRDGENRSHVHFIMPRSGTSIGADPIGMLRGAPSPELAHAFIEFVLSESGQKIWNFSPGSPGGPTRFALRRPPIRKDFYRESNTVFMTDPDVNPYEIAEGFTYNAEWTGSLFSALRLAIKSSCIYPHEEQREAWAVLISRGLPEEGLHEFETIRGIDYQSIVSEIAPTLRARDKVAEVQLSRELSLEFRERYRSIIQKWGVAE